VRDTLFLKKEDTVQCYQGFNQGREEGLQAVEYLEICQFRRISTFISTLQGIKINCLLISQSFLQVCLEGEILAIFDPLKLILVRQRLVKDEVLEDGSIVKFKHRFWKV
jgi:hypothetical protein